MLNKVKFNVRLNIELSRISEDPRNFYETEGGEEIERKSSRIGFTTAGMDHRRHKTGDRV